VRGPLLHWFFENTTDWFRATIQVNAIGSIGTIYFAERTIQELVKNETKMKSIEGFDPGKMRGLPILVGPTREGPYRLIDGATRCCNILRMPVATRPMEIDILLGVCPSVVTWHLWR